jgi:hypothetical protein
MNWTPLAIVHKLTCACAVLFRSTSFPLWESARLEGSFFMKLAGLLLLFSGWILAVAAVALLGSGTRAAFFLAGIAIEALGLGLAVNAHRSLASERG